MASAAAIDVSQRNILIGCTGSIASIKIPELIGKLMQRFTEKGIKIKLIPTDRSRHFFTEEEVHRNAGCQIDIYSDEQEWLEWKKKGDPVLHIDLRRWADLFIIAPLDANTMAKMAHGICDNLLTCVVRAWDMQKPLLFAPAMNTVMWEHPLTQQQISTLTTLGYTEIPCVAKRLACNDVGMGAMAEVHTIVQYTADAFNRKPPVTSEVVY